MRTRLGAFVTSAALVAILLAPAPTHADTRVPVFDDAAPGVAAVQTACDNSGRPIGEPEPVSYWSFVSRPAMPPLHRRSLGITAAPDRMPGLAVELPSSGDLATLRVAQFQGIHLTVSVRLADGSWLPGRGVMGSSEAGDGLGWRWFDASDATAPDLGPVTAYLWFESCFGDRTANVDALSVGAPGDVTTYDFEGSTLRLEGLGASGAPGKARWSLYCGLSEQPDPTQGLVPVVGELLVMESRPHGSRGAFERLGVARTSEHGQAVFHDRPRTLTDYRCRYGGNDGTVGAPYPAMVSQAFALRVPTHVTIRVRRIDHGRVVATGAADPRHPGTRVTLLVKRVAWDADSRVLDRGRLSRRGTYKLSAPLGKGPWLVYIRVAKAPGNAVTTSASRYVK